MVFPTALTDRGAFYLNKNFYASVFSPDLPLVSPLVPASPNASQPITEPLSAYPYRLEPIRSKPDIRGVAFNLFNNVWETNWIFWYPYLDEDKDFRARIYLSLSPD